MEENEGGLQLVKRQKTQDSAIIVGSVTKDVSGSLGSCLLIRSEGLSGLVAAHLRLPGAAAGHQAHLKPAGAHHAAGGPRRGRAGPGFQPGWQQHRLLLLRQDNTVVAHL